MDMIYHKEIHSIIKILKTETKNFKNPLIEEIKEKTRDPFKILISCLLSLRTRDEIAAKASTKLFSLADTPEKMVRLKLKEITNAIKNVNYYKTKAKRIKEISKELIKNYRGKVPENFEDLLKLKGVGRKTANIVITNAFGKYGIAVDTHVHRISNRLGIVTTKNPEETEIELRKKLPKRYWKDFNNLIVIWGQNICLPRNPKCDICKIKKYCEFFKTKNF
jgi:endonuclease-3